MQNIHIGNIIRLKLEESSLSIAEFASKINRTRTTVYDIFNRKSIDIDLLLSISKVLNYNFLEKIYLVNNSRKTSSDVPAASSSHCRYIVGVEVSEEELKQLPPLENQVILKIIYKQD
ncbi:MAG: helix-turn-helix transcriptional regulator [Bacteroides sp.]